MHFYALEAQSVCKVLGFATNALCFNSAFTLHQLGGLKFPRPSVAIMAAKVRAGTNTLTMCVEYARSLSLLKERCLTFHLAFGEDLTPGWDSPLSVKTFAMLSRGVLM